MAIDINQFSALFFDEVDELLVDLECLLLSTSVDEPATEDLDAIFRVAHSIKGGAATFGFSALVSITHVMESLLDKIRHAEIRYSAKHQDILLQFRDVLKIQMNGLRFGLPVDLAKTEELRQILEVMLEPHKDKQVTSFSRHFRIQLQPLAEQNIRDLIHELSLLGELSDSTSEGACTLFDIRTNEGRDDILAMCSFVLNPEEVSITEITEVQENDMSFGVFEPLTLPVELPSAEIIENPTIGRRALDAENAEASTIRVRVEKIDQLINLVGELVITHAMLSQRCEGLESSVQAQLLSSTTQLNQNIRYLQESTMSLRMMPMELVYSRFSRLVHELSAKLDKKIKLVTEGGTVEIDKGLIEKIIDPLTHLIRNSIDHGIEKPDIRRLAGKPEMGQVTISATHQGAHVVLQVSDDGAGLDRDKILAKAQSQGIDTQEGISDQNVWQLIFAPGFSTAEVVTDLSGRGVGMDVVKRNITSLGGLVSIHSKMGEGSTVTISLPLTLAILDGMSIKVGGESYILPLSYVLENFHTHVDKLWSVADQGLFVKVRQEYIPVISLREIFAIEPQFPAPDSVTLVVVGGGGRKAAVLVDELGTQQQFVVKNLESNFRKVEHISGATIMGDGSVSLIIDVSSLLVDR